MPGNKEYIHTWIKFHTDKYWEGKNNTGKVIVIVRRRRNLSGCRYGKTEQEKREWQAMDSGRCCWWSKGGWDNYIDSTCIFSIDYTDLDHDNCLLNHISDLGLNQLHQSTDTTLRSRLNLDGTTTDGTHRLANKVNIHFCRVSTCILYMHTLTRTVHTTKLNSYM